MNCVRVHVITHVCKSLFVFTPVAERTAENIPAARCHLRNLRTWFLALASSLTHPPDQPTERPHLSLGRPPGQHYSRWQSACGPRSTLVSPAVGVCMQHNGAGETPNGEPPPLSFSAAAPLQMATSRVRRFAQEGRTVPPQPRVMVVFSAASDTEKQGDAMSGADSGEEEYRKPAKPVHNLNLGKSLHTLDALEEVNPRCLKRMGYFILITE